MLDTGGYPVRVEVNGKDLEHLWHPMQYDLRGTVRTGHLWQNRFYSCLLDEGHYWAALRYVERNPVRARLVRLPWRYRWSSAALHTGRGGPAGLLDLETWRRDISPKEWEETLTEPQDEEFVRQLRLRTQTGRALASDSFVSKVEAFLGRRVRPLPVGRQRGWRKDKESRKGFPECKFFLGLEPNRAAPYCQASSQERCGRVAYARSIGYAFWETSIGCPDS